MIVSHHGHSRLLKNDSATLHAFQHKFKNVISKSHEHSKHRTELRRIESSPVPPMTGYYRLRESFDAPVAMVVVQKRGDSLSSIVNMCIKK